MRIRTFAVPYWALVGLTVLFSPRFAQGAQWQEKMKALAGVMGELLPELNQQKPDLKALQKNADKLAKLSHGVRKGANGESAMAVPPDSDPSLRYLSTLFERETKRAAWAIREGHVDYGKNLLRAVTGYCIACHTRHDRGPDFPVFPLDTTKFGSLGKLEKANLLAATRQFDRALAEYQTLISSADYQQKEFLDWERALRHGLEISVRVKKDPAASLALIDKALAIPTVPDYVREYVGKWKDGIERWKKEPAGTGRTDADLLQEANRLLQEARSVQQFPADHSGDIFYLRATAAAHESLGLAPEGPKSAEALFVAGSAYEVLNSLMLSPLHEMCFEACIRNAPHTSIARQCYQHYEGSIYFGYSGSGGTNIPFDVEKLMLELKDLSKPPVKASN